VSTAEATNRRNWSSKFDGCRSKADKPDGNGESLANNADESADGDDDKVDVLEVNAITLGQTRRPRSNTVYVMATMNPVVVVLA